MSFRLLYPHRIKTRCISQILQVMNVLFICRRRNYAIGNNSCLTRLEETLFPFRHIRKLHLSGSKKPFKYLDNTDLSTKQKKSIQSLTIRKDVLFLDSGQTWLRLPGAVFAF